MTSMFHHGLEVAMNAGWDDDPAWKAICECGWETWDHATEESARERHAEHRAEIATTGRCSCPTCSPPPGEDYARDYRETL